jgi:hypothetical protein
LCAGNDTPFLSATLLYASAPKYAGADANVELSILSVQRTSMSTK